MNINVRTVTIVAVAYSESAIPAYVDQIKTFAFSDSITDPQQRHVVQQANEMAENFAVSSGCELSTEMISAKLRKEDFIEFTAGNVSIHWGSA